MRQTATSTISTIALLLALAGSLAAPAAAQSGKPGGDQPRADSALRIQELEARVDKDPTDAKAWTQLGILFSEEELLDDARDSFIAALQAAPQEPLSHLNLALCLVRMERWQESTTTLGTYRMMAPDDVRGHALLGRAYEETGQRDLALSTWREGLEVPSMPVADKILLLQEVTRFTLEDREPTDEELAKMAETLEAYPNLLATEDAKDLRDSVEYSFAERARHAMDDDRPEDALALWKSMRERGTTRDAAYSKPLQYLLDNDRLDEAQTLLDEAMRDRPQTALAFYMAGRLEEQRGNTKSAAGAYQRAAAIDPEFPGVNAALGEVLANLGDTKGATDALARAVALGEGGAAASYNMGVVLSQKNRFSEAIPHLKTAIESDPTRRDAYRALGTAYRKTNQFSQSADTYQSLIERFGPDPSDLYQLGFAQTRSNDLRGAVKSYRIVVALQPDNHQAVYNLGNALRELERYADAVEQYQRALELRPGWYNASYNLALSLQKNGEYEKAIEQYELTLEIKETYAAMVNMAICYTNIGDEESAEEYYRIANEIKTNG